MAAVIKPHRPSGQFSSIQAAAFNLDDISAKADAYLSQVRQQAAEIVARANDQATRVIRVAEQQGHQAALQVARQSAEAKLDQQLQTLMPALRQAVESIEQAKDAWLKNWQQKTVQLAVAIAQRVIRRELSRQPDIPIQLVREALELASGNDQIRLHLNPQDHAALGDRVQRLAEQISRLAPVQIVADPEVTPGGCLVKTQFGEIDQRFEAQLARIEEELS